MNGETRHHHSSARGDTQQKRSWRYHLAKWHRNLGYVAVGFILVYAVSGIQLNHIQTTGDPSFATKKESTSFDSGLTPEKLDSAWRRAGGLPEMKRVTDARDSVITFYLAAGQGSYNSKSGYTVYETYRSRKFVRLINRLHTAKAQGGWNFVADAFAVTLIFLAVSGLLITKGKHSVLRGGKWFLLAGLLIPLLYMIFG